MSDRASALADDFEQANTELARLIEGLSDAQWATRTDAEQWPVAVAARHIAAAHAFISRRARAIAASQPLPPMPPGGIDAENARDAERYANVTRAEVLDVLRSNGADAAALVRGLTDEQLDRTFTRPTGETMTLAALIQNALIGHMVAHGANIRAAVGL
jgi:uncharacterized damage-inducible protein DinB